MVNATRDPTRHAEMVAIDRMLVTAGNSSDALCLSRDIIRKSAHADIPEDSSLLLTNNSNDEKKSKDEFTSWGNHDDGKGWKKGYGWKSGRTYPVDVLSECDLYVRLKQLWFGSSIHFEVSSTER